MAQGSRPGGLTALAVINFVWAGFASLAVLGFGFALAMFEAAERAATTAEFPGKGIIALLLMLYCLSAALLITSGIGYLKQKKMLGRILGTGWGCLSLITLVIEVSMSNEGFQLTNLIWVIYPVLTLVLLNTTFKDDFVNP